MITGFVFVLVVILSDGLTTTVHSFISSSMESIIQPLDETRTSTDLAFENDLLYRLYSNENGKDLIKQMRLFEPQKDIQFNLFTMDNPKMAQTIEFKNITSLTQSNFNRNNPTRMFIHGWLPNGRFTTELPDAYFEKGKHKINYIAVNWEKGAQTYVYNTARDRVEAVAEFTAKFIDFLAKSGGMQIKDLVVIGFSLGAHIAGIAGKKVTYDRLSKIIGLDPASYRFHYDKMDERLADSDANIVEVIHTNPRTFGFKQPLGNIDYYPNFIPNGVQPGCSWSVGCSHKRALAFFIESIFNPEFYAGKCESFEHLERNNCTTISEIRKMGGEPAEDVATNGIFYLKTDKQQPYALGHNGIPNATKLKSTHLKDKIWKSFEKLRNGLKLKKGNTNEIIYRHGFIFSG